MQKKYVVRLTDQERNELQGVIKKLKGTGQKVRRAQILLKADADENHVGHENDREPEFGFGRRHGYRAFPARN